MNDDKIMKSAEDRNLLHTVLLHISSDPGTRIGLCACIIGEIMALETEPHEGHSDGSIISGVCDRINLQVNELRANLAQNRERVNKALEAFRQLQENPKKSSEN